VKRQMVPVVIAGRSAGDTGGARGWLYRRISGRA